MSKNLMTTWEYSDMKYNTAKSEQAKTHWSYIAYISKQQTVQKLWGIIKSLPLESKTRKSVIGLIIGKGIV